MTEDLSTPPRGGSFADIFNLGELTGANTRDEQERAEAKVFAWTQSPDERRALMEMLFRPPHETKRGATGLVIRKRKPPPTFPEAQT